MLLCNERCELGMVRAVVVNSGNANAATGRPGFENAITMQGIGAIATGVPERLVAVASTGVIGVPLPMEAVNGGIVTAAHALAADGDAAFATAIQTTDAFEKRARVSVSLSGGTVTLTAQAKGAGMISPGFATLLCFVQTDAALRRETCDLLLAVCVKRSFERISVDGQLSTNDTVILQSSGASGVAVEPESDDELHFGEALDAVMRQLALLIARDGEGARRDRPRRRAWRRRADCQRGRALGGQLAAGQDRALRRATPTGAGSSRPSGRRCPAPRRCRSTSRSRASRSARGANTCPTTRPRWRSQSQRDEVEYEVGLPGEGAEVELFFSDLGHEYVTINAEYTT